MRAAPGAAPGLVDALASAAHIAFTAGKPELADAFRNPTRATPGPLIIRYGLERQLMPGQ